MKYLKNTIYWLFILIVVVVVLVIVMREKIQNLRSDIQLKNVELSTLKDSVTSYKTKSGELYAKISVVEVEKRNLKESLKLMDFNIKDLKEKDVKWRKITNALKLELQSSGSGETLVRDTFYVTKDSLVTDTVWYTRVDNWTNNYLSLSNAKIQDKRFTFDYNYNTGINLIVEGSRRKPVVTATLTDPYANITHGSSISVPHKTKWYEKPLLWGAAGLLTGIIIE